jgi:phenylalanyl-tRNA synthetase alpha chain
MSDLRERHLAAVAAAADEGALEEARLAALGKKARSPSPCGRWAPWPPEERLTVAPALNAVRDEVAAAIAARRAALADAALDERLRAEWLDVTLPARERRRGTIHTDQPRSRRGVGHLRRHGVRRSPRAPRSRTTGTTSTALNMRARAPRAPGARHVLHGAQPRGQPPAPTSCAPIRVPSRSGPCRRRAPPSASSPRAAWFRADYDQTSSPPCSIRSRGWPSTAP